MTFIFGYNFNFKIFEFRNEISCKTSFEWQSKVLGVYFIASFPVVK